jgi:REP element-mobilizing transposase RayT
MADEQYRMDASRRNTVLQLIQALCPRRSWQLFAAHVRPTHLHIVVEADSDPERVMTAMKAFASAELNKLGIDAPKCRRWARHGSTRYLWTPEQLSAAIHYVACNQGEPMALYVAGR